MKKSALILFTSTIFSFSHVQSAEQIASSALAVASKITRWASKRLDPVSYANNAENAGLYKTQIETIEKNSIDALLGNEKFMIDANRIEERSSCAGYALLDAMKAKDIKLVDDLYGINKTVLSKPIKLMVKKFLATYGRKLAETIDQPIPVVKKDTNDLFIAFLTANNLEEALKIFEKNNEDLNGKSVRRGKDFFITWRDRLNQKFPVEHSDDERSE